MALIPFSKNVALAFGVCGAAVATVKSAVVTATVAQATQAMKTVVSTVMAKKTAGAGVLSGDKNRKKVLVGKLRLPAFR